MVSSLLESICQGKEIRNWTNFMMWTWDQQSQILFHSLSEQRQRNVKRHVAGTCQPATHPMAVIVSGENEIRERKVKP